MRKKKKPSLVDFVDLLEDTDRSEFDKSVPFETRPQKTPRDTQDASRQAPLLEECEWERRQRDVRVQEAPKAKVRMRTHHSWCCNSLPLRSPALPKSVQFQFSIYFFIFNEFN